MDISKIINLEYGGLSKDDLISKLNSSDIQLNEFAITLLSSELFKVSNQKKKINLLIASVKDIGFSEGATIPEIEDNIKNYGLSECPLEIAPYLRLHLNEQNEINEKTENQAPPGSLTIFSKPFVSDEDFPKGFYLRKIDGKLWLRGYRCSLDYIWNPNDKFVFQLDKSST